MASRIDLNIGKKKDDVETPDYLLAFIREHFQLEGFFDPCPKNPTFDGLQVDWGKKNFVNPPFSEIPKWLKKGIEEKKKGNKSVFLLTARTSSKYWFENVWREATEILFLEGGIKFKGYENRFPIPIVLVEFDPFKPTASSFAEEGNYHEGLRFIAF